MKYRQWIELIEANREEIIEKGIEQFKDRYEYNGLSGWHVGVEISDNGEVYAIGPMSRGSQTMASYNGKSTTLIRFSTENYEFEGRLEDYLEVIEDLEGFKDYLIKEYDIDEDSEDFEDEIKEQMTMYDYSQFNPEKYEEFVEEDLAWFISEYAREEVETQLDDMITQNLERYVELYEDEDEDEDEDEELD